MTRRPWVLALVFSMMLVAFGTNEVRAQLTPQQKQEIHLHYQQATRAYDLGKYQEAVEEYQKVYEIDGDPVMLYNIAQAYRLNDQPQESIHFYRRYLQRSPEARNREDVERKITAMEKLIEERRKAAALVAPPPPKTDVKPVAVPAPPPPPPVVAPPVVVAPPPPPPPPETSTTRLVVGWSMVGVGVASIAVAIVEGIKAKNRGDQLTQASDIMNPPPWTSDLEQIQSEGKTANIVAIVCGIAGTGLGVAGAIVLITSGSSAPANDNGTQSVTTTTNVSFAPWVGPGLVGGGMGLRF